MPMYEFRCTTCEKLTTTINPVAEHDKKPVKCDHCGETDPERFTKHLSGGNFVLLGQGWAKDGYR